MTVSFLITQFPGDMLEFGGDVLPQFSAVILPRGERWETILGQGDTVEEAIADCRWVARNQESVGEPCPLCEALHSGGHCCDWAMGPEFLDEIDFEAPGHPTMRQRGVRVFTITREK